MSTVSFSGLATGMDTESLVEQLVELRRIPIYRLQQRKAGFESQMAALGSLQTKLEAFQTAAQTIDSANEFAALTATSSNESLLGVTAGSTAAPGTYDITVEALAQGQKSLSQGFDSATTTVGEGDVTFTIDGEVQTITLEGLNTIESLAEAINNSVDGVSASIIYDGSETGGYYISLSGDAGSSGAFTVDMSGLSGATTPTFTETQAAADAELTIDGMTVFADGNSVSNAISGLTLDLNDASPGTEIRVTVSMDSEGVKEQVKGFVDAYNDLMSYLDTEMASNGKLDGNSTARSVQNRMKNLMSAIHGGGGDFSMLAQIGIERQQSGNSLEFDETAFTDALADNYAAVRDLFIEREGNIGKASLVSTAVDELTDSIDGMFKIGEESLTRRIDNADNTIERYERSVENYRTTLERKFLAMESAVSLLQAQGNYLSTFGMNQNN